MATRVELGSKVRDTITGLTGIAVGRTEWLHGCRRVGIQPQELHEGKPVEIVWFDEPQVEVLEAAAPKAATVQGARPGGPQADPVTRHDPAR